MSDTEHNMLDVNMADDAPDSSSSLRYHTTSGDLQSSDDMKSSAHDAIGVADPIDDASFLSSVSTTNSGNTPKLSLSPADCVFGQYVAHCTK